MTASRFRPVAVLPLMMAVAACAVNPRDELQVPRVSVTVTGAAVRILWQPEGAQLVRVYLGTRAGDGYGESLMWSVAANSKNSLRSGLVYGEPPANGTTDVPARPLVSSSTYTIEVTRADPKGLGDGFTNTSNRYVGTAPLVYGRTLP